MAERIKEEEVGVSDKPYILDFDPADNFSTVIPVETLELGQLPPQQAKLVSVETTPKTRQRRVADEAEVLPSKQPTTGIDVLVNWVLPGAVAIIVLSLAFRVIEGLGPGAESVGRACGAGLLRFATVLAEIVLAMLGGMVIFWAYKLLFRRGGSRLTDVQMPVYREPAKTGGNPINIQVNQYNY